MLLLEWHRGRLNLADDHLAMHVNCFVTAGARLDLLRALVKVLRLGKWSHGYISFELLGMVNKPHRW